MYLIYMSHDANSVGQFSGCLKNNLFVEYIRILVDSHLCNWNSVLVFLFQDNVFVNVVASIQYRALADKASDAFYKLSNTKTQIQAYVFDGTNLHQISDNIFLYCCDWFNMACSWLVVIRAFVPKHNLDDTFEQKNEIAKAVEQELEKVF